MLKLYITCDGMSNLFALWLQELPVVKQQQPREVQLHPNLKQPHRDQPLSITIKEELGVEIVPRFMLWKLKYEHTWIILTLIPISLYLGLPFKTTICFTIVFATAYSNAYLHV